MDLILDNIASDVIEADTAETPRPHSLQLALQRMGFRAHPDRQPQPRWPVSWRGARRDDAVSDWQPL